MEYEPLKNTEQDSVQEQSESQAEKESPNYELFTNDEFIDFQRVEVISVDETKPWKPPLEVKVTKADGSVEHSLDANTPFFVFQDAEGNRMSVTAAAAGHIDQLHIKGEDEGSKFDYDSLNELFQDVAKKLPTEVASQEGISDFAIDMERNMGKEGIASVAELLAEGILSEHDAELLESVREQVQELNLQGDPEAKQAFIDQFVTDNSDSAVTFQLVRGSVLVPTVDAPKRDTTELFMVFGPGADGQKTAYTMAPGRHMPRHPNPDQHKSPDGDMNMDTFQESADAWFDTVMLTGE